HPGRRSLARYGIGCRRCDGTRRAKRATGRDLARRPRRHQYARVERERQHPRHATRPSARPGRPAALAHRHTLSRDPRRKSGHGRLTRSGSGRADHDRQTRHRGVHDARHRSAWTGECDGRCDSDWIDPIEAPGVGTPVRGGATFREAHLALEMIADSGKMVSMDFVEINPVLDDRNMTASLAVDLIVSAYGKRIL